MNRINLAMVLVACGLRYGRTVRAEKQRAEGNPMLGAPLRCRRRLRRSSLLLASVLWLATAVQPSHGQIILDGPNVSGNVGLNGVTHGSSFVQFIWSGGSSFQSLPSGDTDFLMRVEPDQVLRAFVSLSSIAGGTNASLTLDKRDITGPLSTATEPLNLDLRRDPGGRIIGRVTVTGGTVQRINLNTLNHLIAPDEFFRGNANANNGADVILPYAAAPSVGVRGSATLIAAAGCSVPVSLANQTVEVPSSGDVVVSWNFDLSSEECLTGNIGGTVTHAGLDGANADVEFRTGFNGPQMFVFGPVSRSQNISTQDYLFSGLPVGNWRVFERDWFNAPYERVDWSQTSTFALGAGETVTRDFTRSMGTFHGTFQPTGPWTLSDVNFLRVQGQTIAASGAHLGSLIDTADLSTGNFDFVVPTGSSRGTFYQLNFTPIHDDRHTSTSFFHWFIRSPFMFEQVVNQGERIVGSPFQPETSQALQVFQIADPAVGIKTLSLIGTGRVFNSLNQVTEQRQINLSSSDRADAVPPANSVAVLLRGLPGTYAMTASAQGTDGGTYGATFELVLGAPTNTPPGTDVENPIEIVNETTGETTTGSITFGEVTTGGETTVSASGTGPLAPGDFRIFGTGTQLYFDIQSTAEFDTAKVCFGYDDTEFQTVQQEQQLTLQHEVCTDPETQTGCSWVDITIRTPAPGYPDTDANVICGETDSFSIFALIVPLDTDNDGVTDAEDNCKATPNPDQTDTDGDGIGNACEVDSDNDGIDDDADNCLLTPNPNQSDLDSDGLGDVCDRDIDQDTVLNENDNCELIANTSQADFDGDTLGDACDPDADNDTVENGLDSCPGTPLGVLITADGCSSEQLLEQQCPSDGDYRNHGHYVKCIVDEANRQVDEGLITDEEKDAIVGTAAKSDIGKK